MYDEEAGQESEVQEDLRRVEDFPRRGGAMVRADRVGGWIVYSSKLKI